MSFANKLSALQQYNQVGHSGVMYANPHQLVLMLMDGALDRIAAAKGFMGRGDVPGKVEAISRIVGIINGLRAGLNKKAGGEIAQNLDDLYDYMIRRLAESNMHNDVPALNEVASLLGDLRGAWMTIPVDVIQAHAAGQHDVPVVG